MRLRVMLLLGILLAGCGADRATAPSPAPCAIGYMPIETATSIYCGRVP